MNWLVAAIHELVLHGTFANEGSSLHHQCICSIVLCCLEGAHAPHLVFCEEILSVRSDRAEVGRTAFDTPARVTAPDVVAVAVTRAEAGPLLVADAVVLFISEKNG